MHRFLFCSAVLFLFFLSRRTDAQTEKEFLNLVDTLSSETFKGRGAGGGGVDKAADFLETEFQKTGAKVFRQAFNYKINVFEGGMSLSHNKEKLILGKDYLPYPASGPVSGSFILRDFRSDTNLTACHFSEEEAYLMTLEQFQHIKFCKGKPGLVLVQKKGALYHSLAQYQLPFPAILVSEGFSFSIKKKNKIKAEIDAVLKEVSSANVGARIKGQTSDSLLIVCAHYDHLGLVGEEKFIPGANDNASGTAFILLLSEYFSRVQPKKDILFIAFAAEEVGLLGSSFYVNHLDSTAKSKIAQVVNFDLMGAGSKGITVTNGTNNMGFVRSLKAIEDSLNSGVEVKIRAQSRNSDHYPFSQKGVPAVFIYTNGEVGGYHNFDDTTDGLEAGEFEPLFRLFKSFLKER